MKVPEYYIINAHGHLLPEPEEIPAFMKEKEIFWIDDNRKFMFQKNWKRPVTDDSFFLSEKLDWMEDKGINHEVLLNLSQLYCNGMERTLARDVIRFQNDYNAKVQAAHPDKFTCGFVVQPAHLDDALEEIERCVTDLGLSMMCLPTHYLNLDGQWKSVVDEETKPVFELANQHNLAIELHPYDAPRMINLEDQFWRFHLIWMCAQTADTYHFYTLKGYPDIFPDIRVCFAHGNQFGQVNTGRRIQGFEGRPDLFEGAKHPNDYIGHPSLYFDTLVHDIYSFRLLLERQGITQIVAGLDDPYPLGEMDSVPNSYPGKVINEAYDQGLINSEQRKMIWFDNVVRWIAGEKSDEYLERIKYYG